MREAIVLAGGFGTRLKQVVPDVPKPMAPIAGRPFLEILLSTLANKRFTRVVLSLGFMAEKVIAHFGDRYAGMDLVYEVELQPLGTGGAIRAAMVRCESDHVFVFNGDTYLDLEVDELESLWRASQHPVIVVREVPDTARFGRVEMNGGRVSAFHEKGVYGVGLINAGCYVLPRGALNAFPLGQSFSLETEYLTKELHRIHFDGFVTHGHFIDIGVPEDFARAQIALGAMTSARARALFLDRDGIINHDNGYTSRAKDFKFIEGIFDLCRAAKQMGYLRIVVTNQAGIGRGYYSESDFLALTTWMCEQFEAEGTPITEVFFCPDHPEHGIGAYKKDSFDRKPNPGMLLRAAEKHWISLQDSIMIGDKESDMQAAKRAGVGIRCHYLSHAQTTEGMSGSATHQIYSLYEGILLLHEPAEYA